MADIFTIISTFGGLAELVPFAGFIAASLGLLTFYFAYMRFRQGIFYIGAFVLLVCSFIIRFSDISLVSADSSLIVLDEFAASSILLVGFYYWKDIFRYLALGFSLMVFGISDMYKPLGISFLENIPGAFGVLLDDIASAFLVSILLVLARLAYDRLNDKKEGKDINI